MSESFELPNPLPPLLPGETRSQYRHRVIPGFTEWDSLGRKWTKLKASYAKAARKHGRDHYESLDTAWAEWCDSDPVAAARFAELSGLVGWVAFDPDPVPAR